MALSGDIFPCLGTDKVVVGVLQASSEEGPVVLPYTLHYIVQPPTTKNFLCQVCQGQENLFYTRIHSNSFNPHNNLLVDILVYKKFVAKGTDPERGYTKFSNS